MQHVGNFLKRNSSITGRVPTDYEIKMLKLGENNHFIDHKGNYITSTGHIVEDYAAPLEHSQQFQKKPKDRSFSISYKKDNSRRNFPTREQIFEQVKK